MTRFPILFTIFMAAFLQNCKQEQAQNTQKEEKGMSMEEAIKRTIKPFSFADAKNINLLKETEIVPTLENDCSPDKNSIYSTSMILAWQELKKALKSEIVANTSNSNDFQLLTKSKSYENGLTENDIKNEITIEEDITIKTSFKKELPFDFELQKLEKPLIFSKEKVQVFGMKTFDRDIARLIKIYNYSDDNHFVISIATTESEHEIIFAKGINLSGNHSATVTELQKLINKGKEEQKNVDLAWKYAFNPIDYLAIPKINFHLSATYPDLVEQEFTTSDNKLHVIVDFQQEIAFNLDEMGVAIEDVVTGRADSITNIMKPKPKKLILDQPFFFILRKKGNENPYFAMKIRNAELMVKR